MNYAAVIELRRNRVLAAWNGKKTGWFDVSMPEDMDAAARGTWLKDLFRKESLPEGKVLLVVPRREAVLLQLELGIPDGTSLADLHSVAKLNLGTHSTLDPHACVIDVAPTTDSMHAVCAAPSELVDRIRDDMKLAGRSVAGVTTRASGIASIPGNESNDLYIGAGKREIEIVVAHKGIPVLSRNLNRNSNIQSDISKIAAEAHRALTSARMVGGLLSISKARLYADADIRSKLVAELDDHLDLAIEEYSPDFARVPEELLPLVQLAVNNEKPVIDLRNVKPPSGLQLPAVRMTAGLGVLAAIVLIGGFIVLAQQRAGAETRLSKLRTELMQLQRNERVHLREEARLIHIKSLYQDDPVWTTQNAAIVDLLPETGLVIDRLTGSETRSTTFSASRSESGRRYAGGKWSSADHVSIDLYASVDDRAIVPRLRQTFIDDPRFDVESKGPELPDRLVFALTSKPVKPEGDDDE